MDRQLWLRNCSRDDLYRFALCPRIVGVTDSGNDAGGLLQLL
jgi:hypothetical protein